MNQPKKINVRIEHAAAYQRSLHSLDSRYARWIEVQDAMQTFADFVLPQVHAVRFPAVGDVSLPNMVLLIEGGEQEAAALRVIDEFCAQAGWVVVSSVRDRETGLCDYVLYSRDNDRRWVVRLEIMP